MILIAKPKPILQGFVLVFRGGGWFNKDRYCRSVIRGWGGSADWASTQGFRVILRKRDK